jgi:hypothetical protein
MRSKSHLERKVFGGLTELVCLFLGKLVHDQLREVARATEASGFAAQPYTGRVSRVPPRPVEYSV